MRLSKVLTLAFLSLFLAGCAGSATEIAIVPEPEQTEVQVVPPGFTDTPVAATSVPALSQPTGTPTLEVTPTEVQPTFEVKTELVATNPEEVRLASGKVQFVEFFAFW